MPASGRFYFFQLVKGPANILYPLKKDKCYKILFVKPGISFVIGEYNHFHSLFYILIMILNEGFKTPKVVDITLRDLPVTYSSFESLMKSNSIESLSELAKSCLSELPNTDVTLSLPKEMIARLVSIIENISLVDDLEIYIPCFKLLSLILPNTTIPISINFVSSLCDLLVSLQTTDKFEVFISNPCVSDFCLSYFEALLKTGISESYEKILKIMENTQNFKILKNLLETVQEVVQEPLSKNQNQKKLVDAGLLKTLERILIKNQSSSPDENLWPTVLECLRFMIHSNEYCKHKLCELNMTMLGNLLGKMLENRQDLYTSCIGIVLCTLFENTNLDVFHEIATPYVIPLVVSGMTAQYSSFSDHLLSCLEYPYNAMHFSAQGTVNILLNRLTENCSYEMFEFMATLIEKVLLYDVSVIELKKIFMMLGSLPNTRQVVFLQSLAAATAKCFASTEDVGARLNQMVLLPTKYYWFHKPSSYLKISSEAVPFIPKKDFSILTWVFPLTGNLVCLADFIDKKSHFVLYTNDQSIEIVYTQDKKTVFKLGTGKVLVENQWNLITVSFCYVNKFISTQSIYGISVNNRPCGYSIEGKVCSLGSSFNLLYIGNSQSGKQCFNGKMTAFIIFNRAIDDFTEVYSMSDYHFLPFISELNSIYLQPDLYPSLNQSKSDSKGSPDAQAPLAESDTMKLKDVNNSIHFNLEDYIDNMDNQEISIENRAERFEGVDIVSAFISAGGLEIIFPLFKSSEFVVKVQILDIIANLCQSNSFELLIPEDFFEMIASVLETISCPTEDLLEIIKKILGRLDWNLPLQSKAFKDLMLNTGIWTNMPENLQENYLGTLSIYVSRHLNCVMENCNILYTHLASLAPLPGSFLAEVFSKLLPKVIELKNIDSIVFLLFKMAIDDMELLGKFLKEISLNKFSRDCAKEATYLMLYFLDWISEISILPSLIMVFRPLVDVLVRDLGYDKKTWGNEDVFTVIFNSFDKKLGQDLTTDCFYSIISICELSYNFNSPIFSDKFAVFVDLITSRIISLKEETLKEFLNCTSNSKFCNLITERPNFPDWLLGCYYSNLKISYDLGVAFFSFNVKKIYLHKLRIFLLSISKKSINGALEIYNRILEKFMKNNSFQDKPHFYLFFSSILEDLLNSEVAGKSEIESSVYTCIIISLVQCAIFLNLIHCTYPPLSRMDFGVQYELLKEKPIETIQYHDIIYLREGGFLRLILKYIFIGLHYSQSSLLIAALKIVLKAGQEVENFPNFHSAGPEKSFSEYESERYSVAYTHFPVRNGDMMYTEEFMCLYTLTELVDILNSSGSEQVLEFTLEYLRQVDFSSVIVRWSKKITSKDLEDFYKLLKDYKMLFYTCSRSRLQIQERNQYSELMKTIQIVSINMFQNNILDQAEILADAKNSEQLFRDLIISKNWITRVHIFLIAYTCMKLNFISTMVKFPNMHARNLSVPSGLYHFIFLPEEFIKTQNSFILQKQSEIKSWQVSFIKLQESKKIRINKKLEISLKFQKKLENLYSGNKIKIRTNCDSQGRMATCCYLKRKQRLSPRKSTMITQSHMKYKASILSNKTNQSILETYTDETDFSGFVPESEEDVAEDIPELKQSIQLDCEKIKVSYSVFGMLEISQEYLMFISEGKEKPSSGIYFGSSLKFMQETKKCTVLCQVSDISGVFPRRYIHKHTAFEIYLKSGKSYFFNVFTAEIRSKVFEAMKSWKSVKILLDPNGNILRSYTKKWKKCEISNLEYILIINKFASRSFNDLSQYPIFPWILKDYASEDLKLEDPSIYRNLKLPIGAQTDAARQAAENKFDMGIDDHSFHFGSHYSTGTIVLHYLIRLEPFSSLSKSLQGGNFDLPDRLFYSIESAWNSGQGSAGDVKELIPELFYLPEALLNVNNEDLGCKQNGSPVNNVILPKWACNHIDFMRKHLLALESNYVSQNLNNWIDMIFGYKQKGKQARATFNVFPPTSYEDNFKKILESGENENYLQGMIEQAFHYGQTPIKVFHSPHPVRDLKPFEPSIFDKYRKLNENVYNGCESIGKISALLLSTHYLILVRHSKGKVSILRISLNELDDNHVVFESKKEKFLEKSKPGKNNSPHHYSLLGEKKILSCNHTDNTIKIHSISGNLLHSLNCSTRTVSCVFSFDNFFFTGSADSSLLSWQQNLSAIKLYNKYFGHKCPIIQVSALQTYQLLFSLSSSGDIIIHEVRTGEPLHGLKTNYTGICTSSLKIMIGYNATEICAFDLHGQALWAKSQGVNYGKFDNSGENFYYCWQNTWGFYNLFDDHKKYEKTEEFPVSIIQLSTDQNYFINSQINGKSSLVFTFDIIKVRKIY